MKTEHRDIIERAKRHNMLPMDIAHELMVHDLVEAALFEVRNVRAAYHSLNEGQQQEVIDRMTEAATKAVYTAISIISSRNVDTIPVTVVDAKFKAKAITVTAANQVVGLLIEGETSADNTYTVIATLADLGPNLSVE